MGTMKSKPVVLQSLLAVAAKFASAGISLVLNIVLMRVLGLESAGYFLIAWSMLAILSSIGRCGFDTLSVRELPGLFEAEDQRYAAVNIISTLSVVITLSSLLSISILIVSETLKTNFHDSSIFSAADLIVYTLPAFTVLGLCGFFAQSLAKPVMGIFLYMIVAPLSVIFYVLYVPNPEAGRAFDVVALTSFIGASYTLLIIYRRMGCTINVGKADMLHFLKGISFDAFQYGIVNVSTIAMLWVPHLVLGSLQSEIQVATFSVCQRVSMVVLFINMAMNFIITPKLAIAANKKEIAIVLKFAALITVPSAIALSILIIVYSSSIMTLISEDIKNYDSIIYMLVICQLVSAIVGPLEQYLLMKGRQSMVAKVNSLGLIVFLYLSYSSSLASSIDTITAMYSIVITLQKLVIGVTAICEFLRKQDDSTPRSGNDREVE